MLATIIAYTFLGMMPLGFVLLIIFTICEAIDDYKREKFNRTHEIVKVERYWAEDKEFPVYKVYYKKRV
jgi:hypothetical protein